MWVGLAALVVAGAFGLGGCVPDAVNPPPSRLPTVVVVSAVTPVPSPTLLGAATPTAGETPSPCLPSSATQQAVLRIVMIAPVHGFDARQSSPELEWQSAALPSDHFFVVRLRDPYGAVVTSPMLTTPRWRPTLPPERAGWWSWKVQVVQNAADRTMLITTSSEWYFWFGPTPTLGGPDVPSMPRLPIL